MRLTVGSLPSTVYWRRRVMVLAVVLLVAVMAWFLLPGGDEPTRTGSTVTAANQRSTPGGTANSSGVASAFPSASASVSLLVPTVDESQAPGAPVVAAEGSACADAELLVTSGAEAVTVTSGQGTRFAIKIKNVSTRPCVRDLGADVQELFLRQDTTKRYSSDECDPKHGISVRTLVPGVEHIFTVLWDGTATDQGCTGRKALLAGKYQLVGRLGEKFSDPIVITLI